MTGTAAPGTRDLAARIDDVMRDAAQLTQGLWDAVARRSADSPAVAELIAAGRAADGGKFLRPRLVAAAYFAYGGEDVALLRQVAAAQQLLHVGLCIHDDAIDDDSVRHGRPTVLVRVEREAEAAGLDPASARRRAEASAILVGDLAINTAVAALLAAPCPPETRVRLAGAATGAIELAIAGEVLDVWSESAPPADTSPLRVAELKTSSYSVVLPLVLGALAAGDHDDATLRALDDVGTPLGVAYQLHDDDLGLFGDEVVTGKSTLSDLRDGKRTEHIRLAASRATAAQRDVLEALLGDRRLDRAGADRVRAIVSSTGARATVLETIRDLLVRSQEVAHAELPAPLAAYMAALIRTLTDRDH